MEHLLDVQNSLHEEWMKRCRGYLALGKSLLARCVWSSRASLSNEGGRRMPMMLSWLGEWLLEWGVLAYVVASETFHWPM